MTAGPSDRPQTCSICGATGTGNFCATCGHELTRPVLSWIERLPLVGDGAKFVASIGRIFRRPITEPVRLATLPSYRDQKALIVSALAVWAAFIYIIGLQPGHAPATSAATPPIDVLFFIDLAVSSLMAWALFRVLAPNPAQFDAHIKQWIVLAAFYLVAHVLLVVFASAAMLIAQFAFPAHADALQAMVPTISYWMFRGLRIAMLVHYAVAFGRLWAMPAWQSGLIMLMAWWLASFPSYWLQYFVGYIYGAVAGSIQAIKTGTPI